MTVAYLSALTLAFLLPLITHAAQLTLTVPSHISSLPSSSIAILRGNGSILRAPITRRNTFIFPSIPHGRIGGDQEHGKQEPTQWFLDIVSRDYEFASYGVDVKAEGELDAYRVMRGGIEVPGERIGLGKEGNLEVRVLRGREYYDIRAGFSPLSLLKNPMVLIGVVGLAFVMGMPYLMENMDPETRAEFEEHQKKSVMPGGGGAQNPLQNFDMAAWMAGKTSTSSGRETPEASGSGGSKRRRG